MPHSTKKKKGSQKKQATVKRKSRTNLYLLIGVIAAIIAIAAGVALYESYQNTTTTTSNQVIYAVLDTSQGNMTVELFQSLTPAIVSNFVSLAQSGFYNNLVWHRLQPGLVIQTGDPASRNGAGNPCSWGGTTPPKIIPFEYAPSLHNDAGTLGIASSGAKQGGYSQFYINLVNNLDFDGSYAVFGQIVSPDGLQIATNIARQPINTSCNTGGNGDPPLHPSDVLLKTVTILNSTTSSTT
jgi:cyclophilin family peptidyl-prolyl cis-trans isomerase